MTSETNASEDREWLTRTVVKLLKDASYQDKLDHSACAKYAEILMKLLPAGPKKDGALKGVVEAVRRQVEG